MPYFSTYQNDPRGLPNGWPKLVDGAIFAGAQYLNDADFVAYVANLQPQYDAWATAQAQPGQAVAAWQAQLAAGYQDATTGITLGMQTADITLLNGLSSILDKMLAGGAITTSSTERVIDINGVQHTLTVSDLQALLLRYGTAVLQFYGTKPQGA